MSYSLSGKNHTYSKKMEKCSTCSKAVVCDNSREGHEQKRNAFIDKATSEFDKKPLRVIQKLAGMIFDLQEKVKLLEATAQKPKPEEA